MGKLSGLDIMNAVGKAVDKNQYGQQESSDACPHCGQPSPKPESGKQDLGDPDKRSKVAKFFKNM